MDFSAPTAEFTVNGISYEMRADLDAYMRLNELIERDPNAFYPILDESGQEIGARMHRTALTAAQYFHCLHGELTQDEWSDLLRRWHPHRALELRRICDDLMDEAEWQDTGLQEDTPRDPFPGEQEEPVGTV